MSESSPERQAAIVGVFVAIGLAILAGALFALGGLSERFRRTVDVTAVFDHVNGLQAGDAVWFSGVRIGTVEAVRFAEDARVEVELAIARDASRHVRADALARVGSDGLIGNPIVVIAGGSADAPPIADGDELAVAESVSPEQVLATFQQTNENLVAITADLKVISERLAAGEGSAGKLLADDALYQELSATVADLRVASERARAVAGNLAVFSGRLNEEGSLPHAIVTDRTTWPTFTATVERMGEASEDAARLVDGASDPATPIGALLQDREAGADVRETIENVRASSELLAEDLEAIQSNFLFRRYFKKKEKEEAEQREAAPPPPAPEAPEEPEPEPEPEPDPPATSDAEGS